ncbi:MAG: hypothetical protein U9N73_01805 [Candidatus Auribacterota bacterium]|nr:hypothetical protein [Candidatus Auribacterota bacterium]
MEENNLITGQRGFFPDGMTRGNKILMGFALILSIDRLNKYFSGKQYSDNIAK